MKSIAKWVAILWSLFCLYGLFSGLLAVSKTVSPHASDLEYAATGLAFGLGSFFWAFVWLAIAGPALVIFLVSGKRPPVSHSDSPSAPPPKISIPRQFHKNLFIGAVTILIVGAVCYYWFISPRQAKYEPASAKPSPAPAEPATGSPPNTIQKNIQAPAPTGPEEATTPGLRWHYEESPEKMGRGTVKHATVRSLNEVRFDFPYPGSQRATLHLRIHPKYGKDVIVSVERGQFLCGFSNCRVAVRFDVGQPQNFTAVEPADHSTTSLFIRGYDKFLAGVRKSKKVYIEAQFYQQGTRVFEFDVSALKW